jgi:hypothetical protein
MEIVSEGQHAFCGTEAYNRSSLNVSVHNGCTLCSAAIRYDVTNTYSVFHYLESVSKFLC